MAEIICAPPGYKFLRLQNGTLEIRPPKIGEYYFRNGYANLACFDWTNDPVPILLVDCAQDQDTARTERVPPVQTQLQAARENEYQKVCPVCKADFIGIGKYPEVCTECRRKIHNEASAPAKPTDAGFPPVLEAGAGAVECCQCGVKVNTGTDDIPAQRVEVTPRPGNVEDALAGTVEGYRVALAQAKGCIADLGEAAKHHKENIEAAMRLVDAANTEIATLKKKIAQARDILGTSQIPF